MNPAPALSDRTDFAEGMLDVGDGHHLYWRDQGDRSLPVVCVLHGGPGGSHNVRTATLFDASKWRIVMFDQRGCGRSTPTASTHRNTTADLVADMETLRQALGIVRWALFGGSWGTRLAMSYGIRHPERCLGFLMRGVFLARREDITWFLWDVRRMFPDSHAAFCAAIERLAGRAPGDVDDLLRLTAPLLQPDHPHRFDMARAWDQFEIGMSSVGPMSAAPRTSAPASSSAPGSSPAPGSPATTPPAASAMPAPDPRSITLAVLEHHYMLEVLPHETPVLEQIGAVSHIPCEMVHGRYDAVCPFDQAWTLARAWPAATLSIAATSGHWGFAPEVAELLTRGAARLHTRILEMS